MQLGGKVKLVKVVSKPFENDPDYEEDNSYLKIESELQDSQTKKFFNLVQHVDVDEVVAIGKATERQVQPVKGSVILQR